jgi:signal transduction histidine kinase
VKFGLRSLLMVIFMVVAAVPVLVLASWIQTTAYQREMDEVSERHLLIARNLTLALERYADDAGAVVELFGRTVKSSSPLDGLVELGRELGFVYFCTLDITGPVTDHVIMDTGRSATLTPAQYELLWSLAVDDEVHFSGVMADGDGIPTIYLVQRIDGSRLVMGALSTDYIVEQQQSIAFGEGGHAAIVDQFGHVIAHPKPDWVLISNDISAVSAVQAMMRRETGVTTFYSPAAQKDMVSGYSFVPYTGWGVMIPQPLEELYKAADHVRIVAIALAAVGLLIAAALSWLLAGVVTGPIRKVEHAAQRLTEGNLTARVSPSRYEPKELHSLGLYFNRMADQIETDWEVLATALNEARAADRAKSEFLANVSHELRTPLNAIIGFSELMKTEPYGSIGDVRYAGYIDDIQHSGHHLRDVINDILDLSTAQAEDAHIPLKPVDVGAVVDSTVQMVMQQARNDQVLLSGVIAPDTGVITSNERRLRQIILNLLSNAIKFTPAGGAVEIRADCDRDAGVVVIVVSDTGIGIEPDDLAIAMAPFGQVDSTLSRRFEGTGLGLPLARAFALKLGGSLDIESTPGKGTSVTVTLPLDPS